MVVWEPLCVSCTPRKGAPPLPELLEQPSAKSHRRENVQSEWDKGTKLASAVGPSSRQDFSSRIWSNKPSVDAFADAMYGQWCWEQRTLYRQLPLAVIRAAKVTYVNYCQAAAQFNAQPRRRHDNRKSRLRILYFNRIFLIFP